MIEVVTADMFTAVVHEAIWEEIAQLWGLAIDNVRP
jgi:hypothetical protein